MSYTEKILINKINIEVEIDSDADASVFLEVFKEREYGLLDANIKNAKDLILDIGAHKGFFSLYVYSLNPKIQVQAYEPEEENYKSLKLNLKNNRVKNIISKNIAIASDSNGRELNVNSDSHNHSFFFSKSTIKKQKINTNTLEKILENKVHCDLVKIDTEGAEYEILLTTPEEILKKVDCYYIEYHKHNDYSPIQIKQLFEKIGYKVNIKTSHYDKDLGFILATKR